jgi:flagellar biogenesis protein FliO
MSIPTLLLLPAVRALEGTADTAANGPDLTRYMLISAGMILAVGALGWVLQRKVAGSVRLRAAKRSLRIVDVLPMGGKKRVAVVRVYDRTFVLGVGEKEISVVSELEPGAVDRDELTPKAAAPVLSGLGRAFEAIRARVGEGTPRPQPRNAARLQQPSRAARTPAGPSAAGGRVAPGRLGDGRGLLG